MAILSHRQGCSLAVLLLVFPCVLFAGDTSTARPTYRTRASEVRVSFFATDSNNRPIATVTKDDFALVDGETVVREFRSLLRSDERALEILLLVDASESVARHLPVIKESLRQIVSQTAHLQDISIVTFAGTRTSLLCSGDCDSSAAQQRLLSLKPTGATPLYDALTFTNSLISSRKRPGVRQVVILYSDGDDNISIASAQQALNALITGGSILYTVNCAADASQRSLAMQQMAEATGGRSLPLSRDAENILQGVLEDRRASYVVSYEPPTRVGGFHLLHIVPKHNLNLRFHCRRGYFYEELH